MPTENVRGLVQVPWAYKPEFKNELVPEQLSVLYVVTFII